MLSGPRPRYDVLSSGARHDLAEDHRFQSSRDGQHSSDHSANFRHSNMEYTDTRSSHGALPASQEDIKDYSANGFATTSRRPIVGWQTITLLFGNYAIALLAAILHFVMMHYLDGKPTDDRTYLTQQHVTWLSLLLVTSFRASLCAFLAVAFTQHMWKVLRHKALHVSSIESLHGVRYNPLLLGKWRVLVTTPVLYLMATVIWIATVAALFPPSALTIILRPFDEKQPLLVSTFDAEHGRDVRKHGTGTSSLSTWEAIPRSHFGTGTDSSSADTMTYTYANAKLIHIAHVVLVAGAVPETASPCFANCSYEVSFEGPVFQCNRSEHNQTSIVSNVGNPEYYTGGWLSRREDELHRINFDTFTMNITRILGVIDSMYPDILQLEEHHILRCEPALATYQVHFAYVNGSRSFTYDLVAGEKLADTFVEGVYPDPLASSDKLWNTTTVRNLQKLNLYGLLDTIVTTLAGSHDQMRFLGANLGTFPYTLSNGTTVDFDHPDVRFTYVGSSVEPNKTLIGDTVFNQDRNNMTSDGPSLVITEKLLNEVVANVTIATMLGLYPLSIWNTTVNATMTTYRNTYSFSQPLLLTLPYSLSLAMSLPFLIIGYLSLRSNGVAALNDSFLQLLVNITRSNGLDRITRPCALGDNEMATTELNNTRIMYGRLSTDEAADGTTHRMGFGLEEEILAASDRQDDAKYKIDR